MPPKATDDSADFHGCGIFHRFFFFFFASFFFVFLYGVSLVENRLGRVTNQPPDCVNG